MKATVKAYPALARAKKQAAAMWERSAVQELCRHAGRFGCTLLLCCVSAAGSALPLAACACCVGAFFPQGVVTLLGCICGYLLRFGFIGAIEPLGIAVLVLAAAAIFRDTRYPAALWFFPCLCSALTAAVGFAYLLFLGISFQSVALYAAKLLLACAAPALYRQAQQIRGARLLTLLLIFTGLSSALPPLGFYAALTVGFAIAVSSRESGLLPTLLCGIGLDLSFRFGGSVTACLCAGALLCRLLPKQSNVLRCVLFWVVCVSWQLLFGTVTLAFVLCAAAGCAIGLTLPARWFTKEISPPQTPSPDTRLRLVAQTFERLHEGLSVQPKAQPEDISRIYDATAEKVCRCCVRSQLCWEEEAAVTYRELCAAAVPIVRRGSALREDFPPDFSERCRHMEGFLTAVNQELEAGLGRRRIRNRLQEGRSILSGQYLFLSRFLETISQKSPAVKAPQFVPDFASASRPQRGNTVSGDRAVCVQDDWGRCSILLCDGMGTGEAAAQESARAVNMLSGLLKAGVAPDTALEILNGFYVLLESTGFATVDLLQLELHSGSAVLYKWGAAPSYLCTNGSCKKIGTASVPPGLCVDSEHTARQYRLSLKEGETLVLVSDGIVGEETEELLATLPTGTCQELADAVIAGTENNSPDDRTVVTVRLAPCPPA